ncbi:MAG: YebC/PmpR family DNA-binding transcriptional regulator [Ignavibacteriales bacterium]|nr:YebC/PmpR family DNA-binding transcriptional regulator [Ignavibacteriales bacterium]
MSGHSKWATTKRKKAVIDAKRGKIFTKLIKEISVAVRSGGPDPDGNPRLRLVVDNAKAANMPMDNIDRAIKKASGAVEGANYLEITYEGYGPGGVAVLVESVTDNKNRTVAEIRHLFSKYGGALGESNSVAWMFERKGVISLPQQGKSEDDLMELILEAGAENLLLDEEFFEITTAVEDFEKVRKTISDSNLEVENASIQWKPKNNVSVSGETSEKLMKLLEMIEDNDDVQNVYTNADFLDSE